MKKKMVILAVYTLIVLAGAFLLKGFSFFSTAWNILTALVCIGCMCYLLPGAFRVGRFQRDDEVLQQILDKHQQRKREMSFGEIFIALYVMLPWMAAAFLFA